MQKLIFQNLKTKNLITTLPIYSMGAKAKPQQQQDQQKSQKMDKASELLLRKLREKKDKFAVTRDNYRIDVGLIVERLPIFLQINEREIEQQKYVREIQNKYKFKLEYGKDLMDFNEKHPTIEFERHDTENLISHQNPETKEIYHQNSKVFSSTDPEIDDPKSIQYAGNYSVYLLVRGPKNQQQIQQQQKQKQQQNNINLEQNDNEWYFPCQTMFERQSMGEALQELTDRVQAQTFSTHLAQPAPVICEKRQIQDQSNSKGYNGVKCFYYNVLHMQGNILRALESQYEEFAWVPRRQLQNYLSREQYESFVHVLTD